jgi:O-methyltransferase
MLTRWERFVTGWLALYHLSRFFNKSVGAEYGLGFWDKALLWQGFMRATKNIPTATSWLYHIILATEILSIPKSVKGDVIECGCWKGGSTASLSLVCAKVGRRLIVADSFEGVPADSERIHDYPHLKMWSETYKTGMYAGNINEVRGNVTDFGVVDVVDMVPGWFSDSLPKLRFPIAFAFLDVDITSSLRDCLRYIWPLLVDGSLVYTDDSCDTAMVKVWYDRDFWQGILRQEPPGYVGGGCGLPVYAKYSSLGYARKVSKPETTYIKTSWER